MATNTTSIPTRFSNYSDVALYSMFRSDEWNRADGPYKTPQQRMNDRREALQELGNRAARDYGSKPVPVNVNDISGYGNYSPTTKSITVSKSLVESSAVMDRNGNLYYRPDSNFRSMANVYHESWHAAQDQARMDPNLNIGDDQTRRDVIANLSNYIKSTPATNDLYRIQIAEKQANEYAEIKTMAAIQATEPYYGKDATLSYFSGSITRTYDEALATARVNYNDPNIDKTLQAAINDCHYNNGLVQQNMPYSYYQIRTILVDQQLEAIRKSPDPSIYQDKVNALNAMRESIQKTGMHSTAVQAQLAGIGTAPETSANQTQNIPGTAPTAPASQSQNTPGTTPTAAAVSGTGPTTESAADTPAPSAETGSSVPDNEVANGSTTNTTASNDDASNNSGGGSNDSDDGMEM